MKVVLAQIEQRLVQKENNNFGIINYDIDNAYPTRIREMVSASGTATRCVERYARFIEGQGFINTTFFKARINSGRKLTTDKLLRKWANDLGMLRGFAAHVNYNGLYQVTEVNIISFEDCRLASAENKEHKNQIAVYDDWGKRKRKQIKKEDILWYDRFTSDPAEIEAQILAAGGIENWKGQIFWYSADGDEYPLASCDPVLEDVDTDAQIKVFRNNSVRSGFLDHVLFIGKGKSESEAELQATKDDLKKFQGANNSTQIMYVEVEDDKEIPELKAFPSTDADKKFEVTVRTAKDSIIECFGIPPVLLNGLIPGKLGTATEIADAVNFYNQQTSRERIVFEETATLLFGNFAADINVAKDFSIRAIDFTSADTIPVEFLPDLTKNERRALVGQPEQEDTTSNEQLLSERLGVGGTTALVQILEGALQPSQKINTLKLLFGLTEEQAASLVNTQTNEPANNNS
ncbi:hypothetical protein [Pedobacter sp. SYP-B3415]|uniref:hypothetical protein n=1 Tax=Pedobacter sp. SYP-B3415 TaxID=2496641 RepID=UPI00101D9BB9|nr:hypothetical protein [Pedobacter sp. SYP-B3415]